MLGAVNYGSLKYPVSQLNNAVMLKLLPYWICFALKYFQPRLSQQNYEPRSYQTRNGLPSVKGLSAVPRCLKCLADKSGI